MKMEIVANLLVAIHNVAAAEAMVLGMKAGLDPDAIVRVVASGGGTSRVFEVRAPLMAANRYAPPSMKGDVWQKDMAIIGDCARRLGVTVPLFAATLPLYDAAIEQGYGGRTRLQSARCWNGWQGSCADGHQLARRRRHGRLGPEATRGAIAAATRPALSILSTFAQPDAIATTASRPMENRTAGQGAAPAFANGGRRWI